LGAKVCDDLTPRLSERERLIARSVRVRPLREVQVREETADRRNAREDRDECGSSAGTCEQHSDGVLSCSRDSP
jgi:hypothetical protein